MLRLFALVIRVLAQGIWPGNFVVFLGKKVGLALTLSTQWCEKVADNFLGYLKNLWGGGGEGG